MKPRVSISTRSSLINRLKEVNDDESWREFVMIYNDLIRRLALKAGLTDDEAQEVVQEVLISVVRNITSFHYNPNVCSFKRWLSNMVRWRAISQLRQRQRRFSLFETIPNLHQPGNHLENIPNPNSNMELNGWTAEDGWKLLRKAFDRVKKRVNEKHFQIYFLHVLKEKPVPEVCRQLNVNRGQVYLAKFRVGAAVEREIRRLYDSENI